MILISLLSFYTFYIYNKKLLIITILKTMPIIVAVEIPSLSSSCILRHY